MIILSIDLGKARTGLAICDKHQILSSPLCVIEENDPQKLAFKIKEKAAETKCERIVLGMPKNMDGTLGKSADDVLNFKKILENETSIPIVLWDERKTTVTAHEYLSRANVRGKKRKSIIDKLSASIILEGYLNYLKNLSE